MTNNTLQSEGLSAAHADRTPGSHLLSDRVVDDHGLAADLRAIMRLGQFRSHVKAEVAVPFYLLVTKLYSLATRALHTKAECELLRYTITLGHKTMICPTANSKSICTSIILLNERC